jgi:2-C-methyl-D-erythritol 4-phosphate cytidylyltransferase
VTTPPPGDVGCILVAAGSGGRLGADRPKAFVELAGRTLLEHATSRVLGGGLVGTVVVVVPADLVGRLPERPGRRVVAGGADRRASVAAGLAALPDGIAVVLVHDVARCLAPTSLVGEVIAALRRGHRAVVPGLPVADTIKQVDGRGFVAGTVDRSSLRAVQTPQGFDRELLARAHAAPPGVPPVTDDAGLVERLGEPVLVIPGHRLAFKITTPDDLAHAGWLLAPA